MGRDDVIGSNDILFRIHVRLYWDMSWTGNIQTDHVCASERVSRIDPANNPSYGDRSKYKYV